MPRKKNSRKKKGSGHLSKVQIISFQNKIDRSVIVYLKGGKCLLADKVTGELLRPSVELANYMANLEYKWSVTCYVFGKDRADRYFKSSEITVNTACKTSDITSKVEDVYPEITNNFNIAHYTSLGWIADPKGDEVIESYAYDLFEKLGAW